MSDLIPKITNWLGKSGYPLELFVYNRLIKRGYICGKSEYYRDVESDVAREIDVRAYHHGQDFENYSFTRQLLIECKKSNKPLLVLCAKKDLKSIAYHELLGGKRGEDRGPFVSSIAYVELDKLSQEEQFQAVGEFARTVSAGYGLVPALGGSDSNVYSGLMGLAKASAYFRRSYFDSYDEAVRDRKQSGQDSNPFEMQISVMVVDAPLFEVQLEDDGELSVIPSNWSVLNVSLPWEASPDEFDSGRTIHVVQRNYFDQFLESLESLYGHISKEEFAIQNIELNDKLAGETIVGEGLKSLKRRFFGNE